jgi:hypothetical protein
MMALDVLVSAVPLEMMATVADKSMAKEAWDAIATMRVSDDNSCAVNSTAPCSGKARLWRISPFA